MPTYSISQLVGKTFFAKKKLGLYSTTFSAKPYAFVDAGDFIGMLDSWIQKGSQVWFLFKSGSKTFVIKYEPFSIDTTPLINEGALTIEQEKKRENDKALIDSGLTGKIEYFIKKYGLYLVAAIVAGKALQGHFSKN